MSDASAQSETATLRLALGLMGALAGACAWVVFDLLPDRVDNDRLLLALAATTMACFTAALAMTGPLSPRRAALLALPVGLGAGGLLVLASTRYATLSPFYDSVHPFAAYAALVSLPLPFLIAGAQVPGGWRDYPALFGHAWSVVVRAAAALLFVGIFWLVLALSDTLLGLVEVDIISTLWSELWFVLILSGAVLGVALAVAAELSDYLSPYLILRLLRLLLPVVLVVVAVFLVMVPIRGLDQIFGGLSAAATLLAMGLAAATLVSTAVDEGPEAEATAPLMRAATQGLALLMPVLAGLACVAVGLRVQQYGWTPARLTAAAAGMVALGYGLAYALVVIRRGDWPARIRWVNTRMALAVIALAALWLTPLLNAERISASSQVARYLDGRTPVEVLDLDTIYFDWGRAGQTALTRLEAAEAAPERDTLLARVARTRAGGGQAQSTLERLPVEVETNRRRMAETLIVLPQGATLPDNLIASQQSFDIRRWLEGCDRADDQGRPGCAAVVADFLPGRPGPEVALFLRLPGGDTRSETLIREPSGRWRSLGLMRGLPDATGYVPSPALDAILDGAFDIVPVPRFGLKTGDDVFVIRN